MLKTDMHSHLLPGIDDGSPDMDTSLKLIKGMVELGYSKLITTPHIMWDMYKNNRESSFRNWNCSGRLSRLKTYAVEINAAAEYFLDDHVWGLLKKNEPLLTDQR